MKEDYQRPGMLKLLEKIDIENIKIQLDVRKLLSWFSSSLFLEGNKTFLAIDSGKKKSFVDGYKEKCLYEIVEYNLNKISMGGGPSKGGRKGKNFFFGEVITRK